MDWAIIKADELEDGRTPKCEHDRHDGCHWCCVHCNYDRHACGACGTPMGHIECSGSHLGWCNGCREEMQQP